MYKKVLEYKTKCQVILIYVHVTFVYYYTHTLLSAILRNA